MIVRIVLIIGVVELFVHESLLLVGVTDRAVRTFLDAFLLSLLSAPLLYLFVIKEFGRRVALVEGSEKREELTGQLISLMDNVPGVVYRGAPDWSINFIGAEVKNLTGHAPDEFTGGGVDWRSIIHPDDLESVRNAFSNAVHRKERSLRVEYRVNHVDSGYRWLEDRRQLVYATGGEFVSVEGLLLDMTERKSMEDALQAQFHMLQVVLDAIPSPIFYKDAGGVYLGCNKAYEEYLGIPKERFAGKTVYDVAPKDLADVYRKADDELFRSRGIQVYEASVVPADGRRHAVIFNKATFLNPDGSLGGLVGTILDITDRKRAEEEVRESNQILRATIQASPLPIVCLDLDGTVKMWNRAAESVFGWTENEAVGRPYPIIPEDKRAEFRSLLEQGARGPITGVEVRRRRKDGSPIDISIWTSPLFDTGGTVTGMMAVLVDITDRKRMEETRIRLEMAVEQSDETIMITDVDGTIQYVNPAFERVTGYAREEAVGRNPRFLQSGKHDKAFYREIRDKLAGGEAWNGRLINKKKNGELFEEEATISPVRDSAGKVINYLGVKRDITRLVSLEKQVRTAQRMEAVGTLAGGIAHDFNNALTGILGFGELLHARFAADPKTLGDLDVIRRCAEQASTLTRQLLTFARRQVIDPVRLDLNRVVRDLLKLLTKVIGEHIEIRTTLRENLPPTLADPGQMEQVLMNLCLNARDAMPAGGRLLIATSVETVEEEYRQTHPYMVPGRYVMLTVSDTGIGMDEKTRDRIFEPFFTTKGPEKGTGLGLAVVYGIVKQHNGFINVYSEPGEGTTFRVYLPAVSAAPDVVKAPERESVRGGNETILLVEDDGMVRALTERTLKEYGYDVLVGRDGEEAVEIYRGRKGIDLILIDVVMPRMGGKEAFDRIRELHPEAKAIFMSGYSVDSIHDSFVLKPGISFLPKPFVPSAMAKKVREALDAARAEQLPAVDPGRFPDGSAP